MPLIHAMRGGTPEQAAAHPQGHRTRRCATTSTAVLEAIESTGAIAYTAQVAQDEADLAIGRWRRLPPGPYKDALYGLAEFSVNRTY